VLELLKPKLIAKKDFISFTLHVDARIWWNCVKNVMSF